MKGWWILAAALILFPASGSAESEGTVRIRISLPETLDPQTRERLQASDAAISLLLAPGTPAAQPPETAKGSYERVSKPGFNPKLSESDRAGLIKELRGLWGDKLSIQSFVKGPQAAAARAAAPRDGSPRVNADLERKKIAAALDVGATHSRQNLYYDNARGASAAAGAPVRAEFKSAEAPAQLSAQKGLKTKTPPAPAAKKGKEPIKLSRVGLETLKGAGEVVKGLFSWRGLATAAAAVAIVTVAPVAVYGFLALGAAVGGYTIGKAIYNGVKGYREGNAEEVYAASREFGQGALTLGLSLYGARHAPTSLKPHFPKPNEYKALISSCDDEAIVITSLLQKLRGKTAAAH